MIVTRKATGDTPARTVTQNVDYATYVKAADEARAANDPNVQAIRLTRPSRAPEFSVDRNGFLVATVHDFALEVPAPEAAARGGLFGPRRQGVSHRRPRGRARRLLPGDARHERPSRSASRVESKGSTPALRARVMAINDDESKASALVGLEQHARSGGLWREAARACRSTCR